METDAPDLTQEQREWELDVYVVRHETRIVSVHETEEQAIAAAEVHDSTIALRFDEHGKLEYMRNDTAGKAQTEGPVKIIRSHFYEDNIVCVKGEEREVQPGHILPAWDYFPLQEWMNFPG